MHQHHVRAVTRFQTVAPLLFLVLVASALGACVTSASPLVDRVDEPEISVVSYNVNFGLAGDQEALELLAVIDADVVLLQETTPAWERAIRTRLRRTYPHMVFHHCCRAGGLATLSKHKIVDEEILPAVSWFPAWHGTVKTPIGNVAFINVHLRPPFDDNGNVVLGYFTTRSVREDEIAAFTLAADEEIPLVVVGDFNETDFRATAFLRSLGYDDALAAVPGVPTWRWPVGPVDVTGRYDHVFFDRARLALVDAHVIDAGSSDHFPVVAVLQRR